MARRRWVGGISFLGAVLLLLGFFGLASDRRQDRREDLRLLREGMAAFTRKEYREASRLFREGLLISEEARVRERLFYNLGNALTARVEGEAGLTPMVREALLNEAVAAYEEALRLEPTDWEAKHNLERLYVFHAEDEGQGGKGKSGGKPKWKGGVPEEEEALPSLDQEEKRRELEERRKSPCGGLGPCSGQSPSPFGI